MLSETSQTEFVEFVHTHEFVDSADGLLTAEQIRRLELVLVENPATGSLVAGTGGVRKTRVGVRQRGKSGGARVLYVYAERDQRIYFLLAYPKNVRESLTHGEKNALKVWIDEL